MLLANALYVNYTWLNDSFLNKDEFPNIIRITEVLSQQLLIQDHVKLILNIAK